MRLPLLELRRVSSGVRADGRRPIRTPTDAARVLGPLVRGLDVEVALVMPLDARHRPIGIVEVARGGSNVVHIAAREVFRVAIYAGASALVFTHNHPAGDVTPSHDDALLTSKLKEAGTLVGVPMLDHVILSDSRWYSFTEGCSGVWAVEQQDAAAAGA